MSYVIAILVTAAMCLPAGAYFWPKLVSRLKSKAQAAWVQVKK